MPVYISDPDFSCGRTDGMGRTDGPTKGSRRGPRGPKNGKPEGDK